MRTQVTIGTIVVLLAVGSHAATFDQMVGAVTPGGDAYLVKHFSVLRGSVVTGVQFYSNDLRTTFPEVTIFRGPALKLSDATTLVELTNVRPVGRHLAVAMCTPLRIATDQEIYVAIRLPASNGIRGIGDGAGIAARKHDGPATSYFATGRDGAFGGMDVDYGIELVFQTIGKATVGREDEAEKTVLGTFLRANSPVPVGGTSSVEFGLERSGSVTVEVYTVSGRRVRSLVRDKLPAGEHKREWDGRDDQGHLVAAGIYVIKLETDERVLTKKLARIR